jgi:hypothetical protein
LRVNGIEYDRDYATMMPEYRSFRNPFQRRYFYGRFCRKNRNPDIKEQVLP